MQTIPIIGQTLAKANANASGDMPEKMVTGDSFAQTFSRNSMMDGDDSAEGEKFKPSHELDPVRSKADLKPLTVDLSGEVSHVEIPDSKEDPARQNNLNFSAFVDADDLVNLEAVSRAATSNSATSLERSNDSGSALTAPLDSSGRPVSPSTEISQTPIVGNQDTGSAPIFDVGRTQNSEQDLVSRNISQIDLSGGVPNPNVPIMDVLDQKNKPNLYGVQRIDHDQVLPLVDQNPVAGQGDVQIRDKLHKVDTSVEHLSVNPRFPLESSHINSLKAISEENDLTQTEKKSEVSGLVSYNGRNEARPHLEMLDKQVVGKVAKIVEMPISIDENSQSKTLAEGAAKADGGSLNVSTSVQMEKMSVAVPLDRWLPSEKTGVVQKELSPIAYQLRNSGPEPVEKNTIAKVQIDQEHSLFKPVLDSDRSAEKSVIIVPTDERQSKKEAPPGHNKEPLPAAQLPVNLSALRQTLEDGAFASGNAPHSENAKVNTGTIEVQPGIDGGLKRPVVTSPDMHIAVRELEFPLIGKDVGGRRFDLETSTKPLIPVDGNEMAYVKAADQTYFTTTPSPPGAVMQDGRQIAFQTSVSNGFMALSDMLRDEKVSGDKLDSEPLVGASTSGSSPISGARATPELRLAYVIAQQLVHHVSPGKNGPVEISMRPEELGSVRMTMTMSEGGISVVLLAERIETAELMRRHIDVLTQEFKNLGYRDVSFTFSEDAERQNQDAQVFDGDTFDGSVGEENSINQPPNQRVSRSGGMDLRL